ncbi:MAG: SDR family NAD(P)-dependent oxidoreductase [Rhodoferax sp.]|nr:SDR family NAD(P)-dependent oxidoreductase [Rhodoferax sp.]
MKQQLFVLTGASRGMGAAMAMQLLSPSHELLCISRHDNPALAERASQLKAHLNQWKLDLAQGAHAADQLTAWLGQQDDTAFESATLINNAGVILGVAPLHAIKAEDLTRSIQVGLEAPLLLTSAFLHATRTWRAKRRVLNISSGLGRRPMASQAAYCAAKAGLDHFTRCVALEEASQANGAKVCSLAPGVIDTDMQSHLRASAPTDFPDQPAFAALNANRQLSSPEQAAQRVLAWLERPDFGASPVADIRD